MKKHGLMPNTQFPMSRDFGSDLECRTSDCTFNNKRGNCSCPSSVKIVGGKCELYFKTKTMKKEMKKIEKTRIKNFILIPPKYYLKS